MVITFVLRAQDPLLATQRRKPLAVERVLAVDQQHDAVAVGRRIGLPQDERDLLPLARLADERLATRGFPAERGYRYKGPPAPPVPRGLYRVGRSGAP